jgi:hypothetical protein
MREMSVSEQRYEAVRAAIRVDVCGDLPEYGGLKGKLVDAQEARTTIAGRG